MVRLGSAVSGAVCCRLCRSWGHGEEGLSTSFISETKSDIWWDIISILPGLLWLHWKLLRPGSDVSAEQQSSDWWAKVNHIIRKSVRTNLTSCQLALNNSGPHPFASKACWQNEASPDEDAVASSLTINITTLKKSTGLLNISSGLAIVQPQLESGAFGKSKNFQTFLKIFFPHDVGVNTICCSSHSFSSLFHQG